MPRGKQERQWPPECVDGGVGCGRLPSRGVGSVGGGVDRHLLLQLPDGVRMAPGPDPYPVECRPSGVPQLIDFWGMPVTFVLVRGLRDGLRAEIA